MTITLIRHAPVLGDWDVRLRIDELSAWIEEYDRLPIDTTPPASELFDLTKKADWIIASSLGRTRDSLAVLGVTPDETDALFDEAPVPVSGGKWLRLRPMQWLTYFRIRALAGWLLPQSDMRALTHRAAKAAAHLQKRAQEHEDIVLMGHGAINHFIGKSLAKKGWKRVEGGGMKNWSFTVFKKML
jgi:broad specificity phosphatase PhoE